MRIICILGLLGVSAAWAADRPDLNGKWQLDPAHSQLNESKLKSRILSIHQTDGSIAITDEITDTSGKTRKLEFQCATDGQDCKVPHESTTVSMYYNGPRLVLLESRGSDNVVKSRLTTGQDGKTLQMEILHIAPPSQKNETLVFTKSGGA